jgi:hypothetical protein
VVVLSPLHAHSRASVISVTPRGRWRTLGMGFGIGYFRRRSPNDDADIVEAPPLVRRRGCRPWNPGASVRGRLTPTTRTPLQFILTCHPTSGASLSMCRLGAAGSTSGDDGHPHVVEPPLFVLARRLLRGEPQRDGAAGVIEREAEAIRAVPESVIDRGIAECIS